MAGQVLRLTGRLFTKAATKVKTAIRVKKYGAQIGKTAKNGNQIFERNGVRTAVNKRGQVIGKQNITQHRDGTKYVNTYRYEPGASSNSMLHDHRSLVGSGGVEITPDGQSFRTLGRI